MDSCLSCSCLWRYQSGAWVRVYSCVDLGGCYGCTCESPNLYWAHINPTEGTETYTDCYSAGNPYSYPGGYGYCIYQCQNHNWYLIFANCQPGYACPDPASNPDLFPDNGTGCADGQYGVTYCIQSSQPQTCPTDGCLWVRNVEGNWQLSPVSYASGGYTKCSQYSGGLCDCIPPYLDPNLPSSLVNDPNVQTLFTPCRRRYDQNNVCAWQCVDLGYGIYSWVNIQQCPGNVCHNYPPYQCTVDFIGRIVAFPCYDYPYCYSACINSYPDYSTYYWWPDGYERCTVLENILPCDTQHIPPQVVAKNLPDCCVEEDCAWQCINDPVRGYVWVNLIRPTHDSCECLEPPYFCNPIHLYDIKAGICNSLYNRLRNVEFSSTGGCEYRCETTETASSLILLSSACPPGYSCLTDIWSQLLGCLSIEPTSYWRRHILPQDSDGNVIFPLYYYSTVPCGREVTPERTCQERKCVWLCTEGEWVLIQGCLHPSCECPEPVHPDTYPPIPVACTSELEGVYETVDCREASTTPAPPACIGSKCRWRCSGLLKWELITPCNEPCNCAPPNIPCSYENICQEVDSTCTYSTTTSTTTTAGPTTLPPPPPPPPSSSTTTRPPCTNSVCRWYCSYSLNDNQFKWTLVQGCPSPCTCAEPTVECGPTNTCSYVTRFCQVSASSTTPPPGNCGSCDYICLGNTYVVLQNNCTGECRCIEGVPCSEGGSTISLPCYNPNTTTTSSTTPKPTTTSIPNNPEGYCKYLCVGNNILAKIADNCVSPNICPDIATFNCVKDYIYYLPCSDEGGYPLSITTPFGIDYDINDSISAEIQTTPPPPQNIYPPALLYDYDLYDTIEVQYIPPPTPPKCYGECRYICLDNIWYLLHATCSCVCQPPEEACSEANTGTEADGVCMDVPEGNVTLPPFPPITWSTTPGYPEVTTTSPPTGYPHGYCKYLCTFYAYILDEQTCDSGYYCKPIYGDLGTECPPGTVLYTGCLAEE